MGQFTFHRPFHRPSLHPPPNRFFGVKQDLSITVNSQDGNPPEGASGNISNLQMYGPGFNPTVSVPAGDGFGIVVIVTGHLSNNVFGLLLFYLDVPLLQLPE
jgi:hypothetical protein